MKIDFTQIMFDLDGDILRNEDKPKKDGETEHPPLRLGDVCARCLTLTKANEKGGALEMSEAIKYYTHAAAIKDSMKPGGKKIDFSAPDIAMIEAQVVKGFTPLISGQACLMLEGKIKRKDTSQLEAEDTPEKEAQT